MHVMVSGVSKSYGRRRVLDNVCLSASAGTTVAFLGPSGSGKSTLLSVIGGSVPPDSGSVTFSQPPRIGWVFQSSPLLNRRTALDNAALGALSVGYRHTEARARAAAVLGVLGLAELSEQVAHRLSGGERQRVALARAICARASVILADEPTASLDADSRAAVCHSLTRAASSGAVVFIATHDPVVAGQADERVSLDRGAR